MNTFFTKVRLLFEDTSLRWRIFTTLGILALFRLGAAVPIPNVDVLALERFFSDNQFFGLLNIFSGGGLSNLSIMMLGVGPFITGSIIMQLLTLIFPQFKEMYQEEGEAGRRKMAQYSRLLAVPLAAVQGFSLLVLLSRQGILLPQSLFEQLVGIVVVVTGSIVLMWLGELISEYGVGNGVSLLIFAGIVSRLPSDIFQLYTNFEVSQVPLYLAFVVVAVVIVAAVVVITEAERPIPITYAKQVRGNRVYGGISTYLPIRLNNAGVMPIIFALSILLFPQMIANFMAQSSVAILQMISGFILPLFSNSWLYGAVYTILVFVFTYFYSAVTFDPQMISTNLQKSGAFIPGVRPGQPTTAHLGTIVSRLTLVGAFFLAVVALLPLVMQGVTGMAALAIGGTSLLIVVSVILELVKQLSAQLSMREY
ncbi:MAG: preprotein translocase subunit SecY [Candidatus Vogelbacteria bacterium]|nr:preprotein translocase subunit SecY [Candidatus Vogelbacteria bacterium]